MKRKVGFVTNSSSVSFIISDGRKEKDMPIGVRVTTVFAVEDLDYVRKITSLEGYEKFLDEWCGYSDYEHPNDKEIRAELEKGNTVIVFEASTSSSSEERVLCNTGIRDDQLPEGVTVIFGEGGY